MTHSRHSAPADDPLPLRHERSRYLLELLDTTLRAVERQTKRLEQQDREELATLRLVLGELHRLADEIVPPPPPPPSPSTAAITIQFSGDSIMPSTNSLVLSVGQTAQASIAPLAADGTPSGGTVSAVSFSFSDPSATVALNPDGVTATVTGVAASAGPIAGSASATVTDTDAAVSTWTQAFTIQTNAVQPPPPPQQLTQSVAVQFSDPK